MGIIICSVLISGLAIVHSAVAELPSTVDVGSGRSVQMVAVGENHACAVLDNGTVKCWGENRFGQLGLGDRVDRTTHEQMGDQLPRVNLGTGRTAVAVVVGTFHSCALLDNAIVKCWGQGTRGQLGTRSIEDRGGSPEQMGDALKPVELGSGRTATTLSAAGHQTCARLDNGTAKCWGFPSVRGM